jgi:cell division transport system permease protein
MRLQLLTSEAWRSLTANLSTTIASALTVLIAMFLLGVFIAFGTLAHSWSNHLKDELVVNIYFTLHATQQQKNMVARSLEQNPYVKRGPDGFKYISSAEALRDMTKQQPDLVKGLTSNPLPAAFKVYPDKGEHLDKLFASVSGVNKQPGVNNVVDGKQISHRILNKAHALDFTFLALTIVLLIASTMLIANTIRLSIFSRRREIEVMKLVGATNWFVRGPFMLEGVFCGVAGALLAIFFLVLGKMIVLPIVFGTQDLGAGVHALAFPLTALILLGMGFMLGAVGSGLTIRRFLRI